MEDMMEGEVTAEFQNLKHKLIMPNVYKILVYE